MRRLLLLLAMLSTAAVAPASDRAGVDPEVAQWVEAFRTTGFEEQDGMRLAGVRGEGRTLILTIELLPSMSALIDTETAASSMAGGMCSEAEGATFFGGGRSLRVEVSRGGQSPGTATIDHCPGPVGQGLNAATYAGAMQTLVGRHVQNLVITAVEAEGDTLVIRLDGPDGWRRNISQATIEAAFLQGLCQGDRTEDSLFDGRLGVRVVTTEGGRNPVPGRAVTSCSRH